MSGGTTTASIPLYVCRRPSYFHLCTSSIPQAQRSGISTAYYFSHAALTIPTNRSEGGRSEIPTPILHCSLFIVNCTPIAQCCGFSPRSLGTRALRYPTSRTSLRSS
ncbi:MAG: hypothetical protein MJZ52_04335 [Bacteroidales bacterium]|nr:hypothetical protein [Bacteroidales bacterium]